MSISCRVLCLRVGRHLSEESLRTLPETLLSCPLNRRHRQTRRLNRLRPSSQGMTFSFHPMASGSHMRLAKVDEMRSTFKRIRDLAAKQQSPLTAEPIHDGAAAESC